MTAAGENNAKTGCVIHLQSLRKAKGEYKRGLTGLGWSYIDSENHIIGTCTYYDVQC